MTTINNEAVERARLLVKEDFNHLNDLPIELQNTIANIYYKIAQVSLNCERGEQFPSSVALSDNFKEGFERFVHDSVFLIECRKSLPGIVSGLRPDVLRKKNQEDVDFMIFALLCVFKYRIPNALQKSMVRLKFERWRRESSVDEIDNLYKLFE